MLELAFLVTSNASEPVVKTSDKPPWVSTLELEQYGQVTDFGRQVFYQS